MKRTSICLLLTATLLTATPAIHAAKSVTADTGNTSWYDVELIVFRHTDPQAGDLESWPADPGTPDWAGASALVTQPATSPGNAASALTPLMQIDAHQLDYDWNRLKHSHDYDPILHIAWMEPLTDHSSAPSVQIGVPPPAPATASDAGLAIPVTPAAQPVNPPAQTPTPVYGSVKFSQYGPYLHFDVDLAYKGPIARSVIAAPAETSMNMPAMSVEPQAQNFQWYRMTQDRRIEAGKLNYFDNPMFGVLLLVTPHPAATQPVK